MIKQKHSLTTLHTVVTIQKITNKLKDRENFKREIESDIYLLKRFGKLNH